MLPFSHCAVPGCLSDFKIPRHQFPKRLWSALKWKEAINSRDLQDVEDDDLCKYSVCFKHFTSNDFTLSTKSRRLNTNAVPSLLLGGNTPSVTETTGSEDCLTEANRLSLKNTINASNETPSHEDTITSNTSRENDPEIEHFQNGLDKILTENDLSDPCSSRQVFSGTKGRRKHRAQKDINHLKKLEHKNKMLQQTVRRYKQQLELARKKIKAQKRFENWDKLNLVQKTLIEMQLSNINVKPKGRRYKMREKLLGVTMYKWSPQYYERLLKFFSMPSPSTISDFLRKIPCHAGVNNLVIKKLEQFSKSMEEKDKYCILLWDEVKLMLHLQYDENSDAIVGFEDWGYRRTNNFADHAIVFMFRGIETGWKLPFFHGFCHRQTNVPDLMRCIKIAVKKAEATGLHLVATVCDQMATNQKAINNLIDAGNVARSKEGEQINREVMKISSSEIIPIYDPPHLNKGFRNNLLTKDLEMDVQNSKLKPNFSTAKFASWKCIQLAYEIDNNSNALRKKMPKLTDEHIYIEKIKKMRVKHAVQVLSRTVANYIEDLSKNDRESLSIILKKHSVSSNLSH